MLKDRLFMKSVQMGLLFVGIGAACAFSHGYAIVAVVLFGIWSALKNKRGITMSIFLLLPCLIMLNPFVIPRNENFTKIIRVGILSMTAAMVVGERKSSELEHLPISGIVFYMLGASVSSMNGWAPAISYLKILNFSAFLIGLHVVSRGLDRNPEDLFLIRASFLAISAILVFGSLAALPFPGVAYYTNLSGIASAEGLAYAEDLYNNSDNFGVRLFSGITVQSQFLGPLLACIMGWVTCDMFFVEKRLSPLHLAILLPTPFMLYMTRARVGVVAFVAFIAIALHFAIPKVQMDVRRKRHIKNLMVFFVVVIVLGCIKMERDSHAISRLVRKTDDVAWDSRSLAAAATESRMGRFKETWRDFSLNPVFGMGFQVAEHMKYQLARGRLSLFSAPIEKGLLPMMVLGETGILGVLLFGYFLYTFFAGCKRRGYVATASLMLVFLATNMGEATFFSPGGGGGVFWMLTVMGGHVIDLAMRAGMGAASDPDVKVGISCACVRRDAYRTRVHLSP